MPSLGPTFCFRKEENKPNSLTQFTSIHDPGHIISTTNTVQAMLRTIPLRYPYTIPRRLPKTFLRRSTTQTPPASRISRIESRLPRFLARIVTPLRDAPISHISAFLLLHELTAVVPLFGLAAIFHYTNWLPPYISEGAYVHYATERFGKWMRKRGWIKDEKRSGRWFGQG